MNTTSETLEAVSRIYVPGVVAFYEKHNPDPFQAAHDEWEAQTWPAGDQQMKTAINMAFVARITELVRRFKEDTRGTVKPSIIDEFSMSNVKRVQEYKSRHYKKCVDCGGVEKLTIGRNGTDVMDTFVICMACKTKREAKGKHI